ncbi:hypothetical protein F3Y22_tig00116964pilonHSYRG00433 [Hibiscus syriacus]|uniref:Peptidase A1 domain-containing protein n=1 Tax=Hibiscus syriacus TaxID=106335 RepID=A0A6A2WVE3_HIBSY|nr:hypothetical protein F3Y22_tig00116964pilonHSYRG00433 [Hibiscus syriacus]
MDFTATLLFFALLISSTKALDLCGSQPDNSDLSVIPIYGRCSPFNPPKPESWVNTIIDRASKDSARLKYLSSLVAQKTTAVPIASGQQVLSIGNYVVKVKIGTPGQTMFTVLDTSNDVAWAPCSGCTGCLATTFSPNASSSYGLLGCSLPQCTQVPVATEYLAFNPNTGVGTIIDSGTVVTRFVQPLYEAIRNEFVKQVKGPLTTIGVFETCFDASAEVEAPLITLHFEGLSVKLPMENTLLHTSAGSRACLAIAPVPNNVNAAMNVIANLQQQNHRILFDVANSRLGIACEICN